MSLNENSRKLAETIQNTQNLKNARKPMYHVITAKEAKELFGILPNYTMLDVREPYEFAKERIDGAILLPLYDIVNNTKTVIKNMDKYSPIFIYCRSGRRSKLAAEILISEGYTNVYDFGGILDWNYEKITS